MNAAPGRKQNHHLHRLHLPCIVQVTQRMTTTKAEQRVVRLRLPTTGAVNLPGMNHHRIDEDVREVRPELLLSDLTDGLVQVTETKIEIETGKGHENIHEEIDRDPDQGEGLVQETEGVVVAEIEVETDIDIEKVVGTIERRLTNRMLLKITLIRL